MKKPASLRGSLPGSLSRAMGPLPLPPRLGRPPALRVIKPAPSFSARPSTAVPRAPQVPKPAPILGRASSVAARLGAFAATPLKSTQPPKRG